MNSHNFGTGGGIQNVFFLSRSSRSPALSLPCCYSRRLDTNLRVARNEGWRKKGGKTERKKKKKNGRNGVPSPSLPAHSPPLHPPFAVLSHSVSSAPSVLSESLSRLFKTHPTLPPGGSSPRLSCSELLLF